jgi:hypothetical protein
MLTALGWLWMGSAFAQSVTSASLSGRIEDELSGAIPNAAVTALNLDRNQPYRTHSDEHGRFRLSPLPPGRYSLTAEHARFSPVTREIELKLGE